MIPLLIQAEDKSTCALHLSSLVSVMTAEAAAELVFKMIKDQDGHESWLAEAQPKDGPIDAFLKHLKPTSLRSMVKELLDANPEVLDFINDDPNDSEVDDDEQSDDESFQPGEDAGSDDQDSETSDGSSQNKKNKKRRVQGKKHN